MRSMREGDLAKLGGEAITLVGRMQVGSVVEV